MSNHLYEPSSLKPQQCPPIVIWRYSSPLFGQPHALFYCFGFPLFILDISRDKVQRTDTSMTGIEMTASSLKTYCKENGLYSTPNINDKIYLHYKGFRCIQNLDEYTNLKCIWLEGNGLSRIEGLDKQTSLRTLFLQENIIEKIENLQSQMILDTLNLSKNYIKRIENLSHMKALTSLNLSHNLLANGTDIEELAQLTAIQTIDLQHNHIIDVDIVNVLSSLKDLRVLYLVGNPVVKSIKHYRRVIISKCKNLKYLDDRPVFDDERRRVESWMTAYIIDSNTETANQAERNELIKIRQEKDDADERNFNAFKELMQQGLKSRPPTDAGDSHGITAGDHIVNKFSGDAIIDILESVALRETRESRLAATMLPVVEDMLSPIEFLKVSSLLVATEGAVEHTVSVTEIEDFSDSSVLETSDTLATDVTRIRFSSLLAQSVAEIASDRPIFMTASIPQSFTEDEEIGGGLNRTDLAELD